MAEREYWADDPNFPSADWREDVANGYTRQSYADWIVAMQEEALEQKQFALDAELEAEAMELENEDRLDTEGDAEEEA